MDTVEELAGTYFYAGRYNLSASELFFMIFCEETATQLGIEDIAAVAFIHAGRNISPTRGNFGGLYLIPLLHPDRQEKYLAIECFLSD
ncbi:Uncharacterised protein [Serratia rubidaea]|uniref:Uncharacterized protein n=1 Tax=Serratia rubidaea TaxID=61652 RepID=A0A4U9HNE6_SERRU|nr:Uncharacterised protein [Serratia rubidaea]CAI1524733.1 Uncharacterised protein [Serratia rubidaea]VTP64966.1 Uncharacterised protein [Serratia rubidaea]